MMENVLASRLSELDDIVAVQCTDGNWDYSPYMMGLANGLLIARSIMDATGECDLKTSPERWGSSDAERISRLERALRGAIGDLQWATGGWGISLSHDDQVNLGVRMQEIIESHRATLGDVTYYGDPEAVMTEPDSEYDGLPPCPIHGT